VIYTFVKVAWVVTLNQFVHFRSEVERYGPQSKAGEFVYDHPFLWGSKRTGPDLLRVGGKYNDNWHFNHFWSPQSISAGSIMPAYQWLFDNEPLIRCFY
jgi:cytochrome c oxidase cbb3-type subunit I/II